MNDMQEIAKLAEEASQLYQVHGSADTAALLLEKAGNIVLDYRSVDALRLFQRASDVALVSLRFRIIFSLTLITITNDLRSCRCKITSNKRLIS